MVPSRGKIDPVTKSRKNRVHGNRGASDSPVPDAPHNQFRLIRNRVTAHEWNHGTSQRTWHHRSNHDCYNGDRVSRQSLLSDQSSGEKRIVAKRRRIDG